MEVEPSLKVSPLRPLALTWSLLVVWLCVAPSASLGAEPSGAGAAAVLHGAHFPSLPSDLPAGSGAMQPCFGELAGAVRCGRFRVFEDRASRQGRTLDLAFVLADSLNDSSRHSDAVTFLLGGPGSSVIAQAAAITQVYSPLRAERDLLLLDLRGVGASEGLDCGVPYPGGVASRFGQLFAIDHLEACRRELEKRARLDLYTSNHTMDDLDELRAWLNVPQLNFYSGSYGAREVQVFLRRHPDAVRTAVLNAASSIAEPSYVTHARGLQDALDRLIAECGADEDCRRDYPDLARTVHALFERLRERPVPVQAVGEAVVFGAGDLGYALRGLLYRRGGDVPWMVYEAKAGRWQPLADYYLERQAWVGRPGGTTGFHLSVLCAEDIAPITDQEVAQKTANTFLRSHLIDGYRAACRRWRHAELPSSFWEPVASDVPVLILSGEHDPVTPPSRGASVALQLPNSLHVVLSGGHGVSGPCVDHLVRTLIEKADVAGLDTSCVATSNVPTEFRRRGEVEPRDTR